MIFTISSDADRVAYDLLTMGARMNQALPKVVNSGAEALRAQIVSNASGRPGPNIVTGDYVASWQIAKLGIGDRLVYTDAPQARRLENGFVGVDSLGRDFNQPPLPHVLPAVTKIDREVGVQANALVASVIRGGNIIGKLFRR